MRFVHLSDLHLGKRVNEFPMIDDQRYILDRITEIIRDSGAKAVVIAGDIYEKPVPPAEAVELFDDFISDLAEQDLHVMIISGNHDSAERLSFGSRIMSKRGIHLARPYDGAADFVTLSDEHGTVNFYLLPFIKPAHVRAALRTSNEDQDRTASGEPEEMHDSIGISSYTDAVKAAIDNMDIDAGQRNVIIAHQFVTGAERSDSEEISVGGLDNVDASVFEPFDYTALGHLHRPQNIGSFYSRYSGTPLKYSFSEVNDKKSVTIVDLGAKGNVTVDTVRLTPQRDMKVLRGSFSELTDIDYFKEINKDDYFRIILTDEEDVIGALADLRAVYPNIMRLEYDNTRTRASAILPEAGGAESRTPLELFADLYRAQNGKDMDEEQTELISSLIEKAWSERK